MKTWMKVCLAALIFILLYGTLKIIQLKRTNERLSQELAIQSLNLRAYSDSLRTYELNTGETLFAKSAFVEREEISKDVAKTLGSPVTTSSDVEMSFRRDTIYTTTYVSSDTIHFTYEDDWLKLKGLSKGDNVSLFDISVPVPIAVGQTEDYQVYVKSNNPYINVTSIESKMLYRELKNNTKHWAIGLNVGPGVYYGFSSKKFDAGIGINIGLSYNF